MVVRGRMMDKTVKIGPILGLWVGITKLIKALNLLKNRVRPFICHTPFF